MLDLKSLEEHFDAHHAKVAGLLDEARAKQAEITARLDDLEQKGARVGRVDTAPASLGQQFVEAKAAEIAALGQDRAGRVSLSTKATITTATTDAAGSGGAATLAPFRDGIVPLTQRRMTVRDLLPTVQISSGSVEIPKLKARTNNAAPVAEAAAKPQSDLQFEMETVQARVIAHWVKASRQVLEDAPQLRGIIDNELTYGLKLVEEAQLLNGDGTGQNLEGLVTAATAYSAPFVPVDDNGEIDQVGLAILQLLEVEHFATGIIMNPRDWMRIRLSKDGDGNYIMGPPGTDIKPMLFGVPVVATQAMSVDKFMVGNFQAAATLYDRWEARVEVGYVNDDFTKNLVSILAEERIALAVKQPLALTFGDFGNVA